MFAFFFFKQKTAYEMRISDWSSDVCSSDLEPGDMEEAMTAANAIGDDTLMRSAGQRPVPESFTHGTSAQRMTWLRRGLETGDPRQCDTFNASLCPHSRTGWSRRQSGRESCRESGCPYV